jgi:hypothetical protein
MLKESRERNNGKIIMKGILQKADTLNQNGRIYPKPILEREVRNYQKFIIENRALGECVPPGTQIMTKDGWKNIEDISEDEIIFTLNVSKNEIELQRISRKVVLPYDGKMYRFRNHSSYDMTLTENHNILMWNRRNEPVKMTAGQLFDAYNKKDSHVSHSYLRRAGANWIGENPPLIRVGKHDIDSKVWAAFLGIYLSEGHASGVVNPERAKYHTVVITQKDENVVLAIKSLLSQLPWKSNEIIRKDGLTRDFVIIDADLHSHLYPLGSSRQKYVPKYTKLWSSELQGIMLEWMLLGDGKHRKGRKGNLINEYCTTSSKLANDVFEIMMKLGSGATIHTYNRDFDRPSPFPGRIIKATSSAPMNIVYQHSSKSMSLDFRFMQAEQFDFKGDVFCVTVPNGTWLMKSNGKICWTHNCDHPESSVINLKNVSHIVREAYFEGNTVYGTVELLDTPSGKVLQSLVESGVKLGISSRGVGSTKKTGDYYTVEEDFQLICWDFVSEPSTPGAFMLAEGKDISDAELKKIFNRSDRVDRILNDILFSKGGKR